MLWGRLARFARSSFEEILDAIVPPRARSARTKSRSAEDIALKPASHALLGERIVTLMDYRSAAVQDLIRSLKYDGSRHAARLCAQILAEYLVEEIAAARAFSPRRILLVPMPLHRARQRERGFNQIARVLQELPQEFEDKLALEILTRTRPTPRQTTLPRRERLKNVAGAFALGSDITLRDAHVFLIDDVTTTGATLLSASKPLRKRGAQVTLIALARA